MKAVIVAVLAAGVAFAGSVSATEANYKAGNCFACHDAGISGAAKLGDKAAWAPRIAKGMDTLYATAIGGSKTNPAMMPRGGSKLSDADLKSVVDYMVSKAK